MSKASTEAESERALPCPFCGEEPAERDSRLDGYMVGCRNARCASKPEVYAHPRAAAIAGWNRRASPAASDRSEGEDAELAAIRERMDAALKFKKWVHDCLDNAGVPHDPEPEHTAQYGCRISGRMRWLFSRLSQSEARLRVYEETLKYYARFEEGSSTQPRFDYGKRARAVLPPREGEEPSK